MKISVVNDLQPLNPADFDLFDPQFYAHGDPHPLWASMRADYPLHRQKLPDGRVFASVTRHADAMRVLGDHEVFTSARGSLLNQLGRPDPAAGKMVVSTDPPRHGELRRPLNAVLGARALRSREQEIRQAARWVLRNADGEWDLAERAVELPMAVAGSLMGLPEADWPRLSQWTSMAASPAEPEFRVHSPAATLAIAHHGLFEYFADQISRRDRAPGGDLIGHLTSVLAGGSPLTGEEIIYNCYSVLLGANATTPHTVTGTVLALIERGGCPRPAPVDGLVEEGLRWTSPASSFLRYAVDDVRLSGGVVHRGEAVAVWIGAANRDEKVFEMPYHFDVRRRSNRHLSFGHGPHYCVGAQLARMTLRIFYAELFARYERIDLAGPVTHLASNFIAGMTHFPVRTKEPVHD